VAVLLNAAWPLDPELALFLWLAVTALDEGSSWAFVGPASTPIGRSWCSGENYVVRQGQRRLKGTKTDEERPLSPIRR